MKIRMTWQLKRSKHNGLFIACLHWCVFHYMNIYIPYITIMYFPAGSQLLLVRTDQCLFMFYICFLKVAIRCECSLTYSILFYLQLF